MSEIIHAGSTIIVRSPGWTGAAFSDPVAQTYWSQLPGSLQTIARAELAAGNTVSQILHNADRGIWLLGFERGPLTSIDDSGLTVHRSHRYGNYCYDGTTCTLEDPITGCFLAFDDPDWVEG